MSILKLLQKDVRYKEGINACMNCGICTAICPAAEFYDYDPRGIVTVMQSGNEERIKELLESDTIWLCGQCMSCKTRCPRGNCPGLIISVLRKVSQKTGAFIKSKMGRQQYLIEQNIGRNILKSGYCTHPSVILPEQHPEQGTVWKWIFANRDEVYESVGANLDKEGPGAMRKISKEVLYELTSIFRVTGGLDFFKQIGQFSMHKARELGFSGNKDDVDMISYLKYLENE